MRAWLARALAVLLAAAGLWGVSPASPALPAAATVPAGVVVVGVPGLRWDDVTAAGAPTLWRLAGTGTTGALSVKAGPPGATCAVDGWLTLGAGNRAASGRCVAPQPRVVPATGVAAGPASVPDLRGLAGANRRRDPDVRLGALATASGSGGGCTAASGSGAALAAADPAGSVATYTPGRPDRTFLAGCPATVVALPAVTGRPGPARRRAAATADAALAAVDSRRPAGSVLLVVGVGSDTEVPHLQVAVAVGPGFPPGRLVSASTRRAPYVQLVDVLPTVLSSLRRTSPPGVIGEPWHSTGGRAGTIAADVHGLRGLDRAADAQRRLAVPFVVLFVGLQALVYGLVWLVRRRSRRETVRTSAVRVAYGTAVAAAAAPGASFLASVLPWARAPAPAAALAGAIALAGALLVALAAAAQPPRGRTTSGRGQLGTAGNLATVTFALLVADLLTGARLQIDSVAGYSPLVAGRFAGIGNLAFGVLGAAALLAAAGIAAGRSRRGTLTVVAAVGLVAVVADGAPPFGSDVGGVLALVPAFAVLAMLLVNGRVSWRPLLLALLAGAAVVAGFGLLDYSRAQVAQTHLGRFVGQVLHGGAADVVRRKAAANLHLLTANGLTLVVPAVFVLVAVLLLRPPAALRRGYQRAPVLRPALLATLVLIVVGFAVNDSGVAVAGMAMAVAIPVTIAVCIAPSGAATTRAAATRDTPPPSAGAGSRLLL